MGPLFEQAGDGGEGGGNGGGTGNPGLDAAGVQAMIDKSINGFGKRIEKQFETKFGGFTTKLDTLLERLGDGSQGGNDGGDGGDDGDEGHQQGGKSEKISPKLKAKLDSQEKALKSMQNKLDAETKARQEAAARAEETERHSAIRSELGKYPLRPEAVEQAFKLFKGDVARSDDGTLIVGETTMEAHIKATLDTLPGLLKPEDKGGAGSSSGGKTGRVQLEDIRQGMSAETEAAALRDIASALKGAQ